MSTPTSALRFLQANRQKKMSTPTSASHDPWRMYPSRSLPRGSTCHTNGVKLDYCEEMFDHGWNIIITTKEQSRSTTRA